jgi:hypothetical protein
MLRRALLITTLLLGAAACDNDSNTATTPSAAQATDASLQPAERITTLPSIDDGCSAMPPSSWESFGSVHTIMMATDGIVATIDVAPHAVCPGGQTVVTMTFTNPGSVVVTIEAPRAILGNGGMSKWELAVLPSVTVQPGATETRTVIGHVPLLPPADYTVGVYGYESGSTLTVEAPTGQ